MSVVSATSIPLFHGLHMLWLWVKQLFFAQFLSAFTICTISTFRSPRPSRIFNAHIQSVHTLASPADPARTEPKRNEPTPFAFHFILFHSLLNVHSTCAALHFTFTTLFSLSLSLFHPLPTGSKKREKGFCDH
uniref:Uncharacterized protein n=1 Tax=Caenorhabditis japonica TaxID=281687 RepID=A0A8R1ICK5_CAEJA